MHLLMHMVQKITKKKNQCVDSSPPPFIIEGSFQLRLYFLLFFDKDKFLPFLQTSETRSKIFLVNCLCAIQQPLLGHDSASEYVKKLGGMIENHIHDLVGKEVDAILRRCGLSTKMPLFHNSLENEEVHLAEMEETSQASLSECLKAFFGLILGRESALPEFEQMQVPRLRSEACVELARSIAEAYELIYKAIMFPKNGYTDPKSLARHPPDQIRTILGI